MVKDSLPKFDAPPVIETAISVQFSRLIGFSTPMAGWFWKSYLPSVSDQKWVKATEAPRLADAFEKFGDQELWGRLALRISPIEPNRVQLIESGEERMVQVQDSRFILNWRKKSGPYPSFEKLSSDFWLLFPEFEKFAKDAGTGPIEQNQWEVTYVNDIPKGDLWTTPAEWGNVIPGLRFPQAVVAEAMAEPITLDWRFNFGNQRGRLYVSVQHARSDASPDSSSFMRLTLTARGPIDRGKGWDLRSGLGLGHEAIVRNFTEMTSAKAHGIWKRRI